MTYTIYRRFITINGKEHSYVGFTIGDPWYLTASSYRHSCPKLAKAINRYGWERFELGYLDFAKTKKTAMSLKQKYISKLNSIDDGFNIVRTTGRGLLPVLQFNLEGNLVSRYSSLSEAAQALGTTASCIHSCLTKKTKTCCGYIWIYDDGRQQKRLTNQELEGVRSVSIYKPVLQYDSVGRLIAEYPSSMDASNNTGIDCQLIKRCCKGNGKTAGGYIWIYKTNDKVEHILQESEMRLHAKGKMVLQFDKTGKFITAYSSIYEASKKTGIKTCNLSNCCNGKSGHHSAGGYIWEFKECA